MKFWLISFGGLFVLAEATQWLWQGQGVGKTMVSLPVVVLGGIGLAIASNYRYWLLPPSMSSGAKQSPSSVAPFPPTRPLATKPQPEGSRKIGPGPSSPPQTSISFEIPKKRP